MNILIQCGDHFENQSRILLLAESLLEANQNPIILMYKKGGGNLFKSRGIRVAYLSDYKNDHDKDLNFKSKIHHDLTVMDFVNVEIRRNPRLGWPSQVRKTSNAAFSHLEALSLIIENVCPDHIVIWNGFTGYVANTLRVLAEKGNIAHSFIERGLLKQSLFIDKQGVNGASSLSAITDYSFPEKNLELESFVSKTFLEDSTELEYVDRTVEGFGNKRIVFFPLQVQLDTNIILYSPYNTMREVFFEIYKNLNDDNTVFIIRPHPEEDPKTFSNFPKVENVYVSIEQTLAYWLDVSDLIVTINSTVGLEALIKGKSVVCLGKSIYSSLSCLSTYHQINYDKNNILQKVKEYLCYLTTHNLLIKDSFFNKNVINAVFELEYEPLLEKKEKVSQSKGDKVFCDFSFGTKLNLTYRKNAVPITLDWLDQILKPLTVVDYDLVKDSKSADIVVTDKSYEDIEFLAEKLYLDVYGVRLR